MTGATRKGFATVPVRVALLTTVIVAVLYAVTATALVLLSRNALMGGIDARLARQLAAIQAEPDAVREGFGGATPDLDNDGDARRFDAPLVVWVRGQDGAIFQTDRAATLPSELASASGPLTATIGGVEMRLVGGQLPIAPGAAWVTIGQSLGEATGAVNTLITAELLIAPGLLVVVFIGALLVGRRVAHPIEQARLAQLAFTADASHELRTPLAVIQAETSLALRDQTDPGTRQTLGRIEQETQVLRSLVDDLLWLARFDSAPSAPEPEPVDLAALATDTVERFAPIARQRGTTIVAEVSDEAGAFIKAPPEWVARLMAVLADNAVRHSPPQSHVMVAVVVQGNRVRVTVDDDGPGIPADQREQVFNRFHRASDSGDGAGLGLAIADAIVDATGGRWDVGASAAGGARLAVSWHRLSSPGFTTPITDQT